MRCPPPPSAFLSCSVASYHAYADVAAAHSDVVVIMTGTAASLQQSPVLPAFTSRGRLCLGSAATLGGAGAKK